MVPYDSSSVGNHSYDLRWFLWLCHEVHGHARGLLRLYRWRKNLQLGTRSSIVPRISCGATKPKVWRPPTLSWVYFMCMGLCSNMAVQKYWICGTVSVAHELSSWSTMSSQCKCYRQPGQSGSTATSEAKQCRSSTSINYLAIKLWVTMHSLSPPTSY